MIVGISCDTPAENKHFRDKFSFPFDLLCDVDKSVSLAYGAVDSADASHPSRISYLIDAEGNIVHKYIGAMNEQVFEEQFEPRIQQLEGS